MQHQTDRNNVVLIVDDEKQLRRMIALAVQDVGYSYHEAPTGKAALQILENETVDVVLSDIAMPEMDGIRLTEQIKTLKGPDVILMTGYFKDFSYGEAISKGASDFIQKPFEIRELLIRLERVLRERAMRAELESRLQRLTTVLEGIIQALSLSIDARDPYTAGHQRRVAGLAVTIAEAMGLSQERIAGIRMAGTIHDLGKIAVPAEILSKPNRLSDLEFNLIKTHPQVGYNILREIEFPWPIAEIIYQHHERVDGSGYPRGLKGDDILLEAKIMAVADVVEAIASHRPYRPALKIETAIEELSKNKGSSYDPMVADECLKTIGDGSFEFES